MIITISLLILVYGVVAAALWQSRETSLHMLEQQKRHLEMVSKMQEDISRLTETLVRASGGQVVLSRKVTEPVPTAGWYEGKPPESFIKGR